MRSRARATTSSRRATSLRPCSVLQQRAACAGAVGSAPARKGTASACCARPRTSTPDMPVIVMTAYGSIEDAVARDEGRRARLPRQAGRSRPPAAARAPRARAAPHGHREPADEGGARGPPRRAADRRRGCVAPQSVRVAAARRGDRYDRADRRRERHRQGAVRPLASRAERPRRTCRLSRSTARRFPKRCSRPSCSATRRGRSPAPSARKPGKFEMAHRGTLFLDEIGDLPLVAPGQDPARARREAVRAGRRHRARSRWTSGSSPRPTAACARRWRRGGSARTCSSGCRSSRSRFRRCASGRATSPLLARYFVDRFCRDMKKRPLTLSPTAQEQLVRLSLARERARAAELHRARGDPRGRRHASSRGI